MNDRINVASLDDGDGGSIADERVAVAILGRGPAAQHIGVDQDDLADGSLLEQQKGLDESDHESRAALIDIQAKHVLLQCKATLDDAAGRRHQVVGRLRDEDERVDLPRVEQPAGEEMLQAMHGEIRHAHARLNQPVFVVTHHLFELERTVDREVEVLHLLEKRCFIRRHHGQQTGKAFAAEREVHGATPYLLSSAAMVSRFRKCAGTMSTPSMAMPWTSSRVATRATMSKESSMPSARKSCDLAKSNSGRISLSSCASVFTAASTATGIGRPAGQQLPIDLAVRIPRQLIDTLKDGGEHVFRKERGQPPADGGGGQFARGFEEQGDLLFVPIV